MFILVFVVFIFGFTNVGFIILVPCFNVVESIVLGTSVQYYSIGFIIPWAFSINPLGLLFIGVLVSIPWIYCSFGFIISIPWIYYSLRFIISIMVNHGWMSHYDKYCLTMKINHVYFSVSNIYIWVYHISPMVECPILINIVSPSK